MHWVGEMRQRQVEYQLYIDTTFQFVVKYVRKNRKIFQPQMCEG